MYNDYFNKWYFIIYDNEVNQAKSREDATKIVSLLDLHNEDSVLDICCGWGRHIIHLSPIIKKGCGLDNSDFFIDCANKIKRDKKLNNIEYIKSDIKCIPYDSGYFTKVYNFFTSFGVYSEDDDNQQVLNEVSRVLSKGGKFLLDIYNPLKYIEIKPKFVIKKFSAILGNYKEDPIILNICRNIFQDGEYKISSTPKVNENKFVVEQTRIIENGGKVVKKLSYQLKLYTLEQLKEMMRSVCLEIKEIYGSLDREAYNKNSKRLVIISEKL